jgi:hypothetical protein
VVTGEWRKLHKEELNDLYWSGNIVRVIKSRRVRWAGHVERMGERCVYRVLLGNLREGPVVDERIILRWIFRRWDAGEWTGLIWLSRGTGGGLL